MAVTRSGDSNRSMGYGTQSSWGSSDSSSMYEYDPDAGRRKVRSGYHEESDGVVSVIGLKEVLKYLAGVDRKLAIVIMGDIPHLCDLLAGAIRRAIGRYFPGMPKLKPETIKLHEAAGHGDTPLLYTGDLQSSIQTVQDNLDVRGKDQGVTMKVVSSGMSGERLLKNMHGYAIRSRNGKFINIPARDPVTPTIDSYLPYLYREVNKKVRAALGGGAADTVRGTWRSAHEIIERNDVSENEGDF